MRVGWFSSGRGPGSQALLSETCAAIESGDLDVEIAYLFCNRERGEHEPADRLLDLAEAHGVPVLALSSSAFRRRAGGEVARAGQPLPRWRSEYDLAIARLIEPHKAQIAVLAGYQLIAPELCRRFDLINLHPAAPGGPVGLWQEVIWQLIESRALQSGITIFLATPELDRGPAISFCRYSIRDAAIEKLWQDAEGQSADELRSAEGEDSALFREIRSRGAMRESALLLETLRALAAGRIRIAEGQVLGANGTISVPLDLSAEVDKAIGAPL